MTESAILMTSMIVDDETDARDRMACLLEKCEHINNLESIAHPADALKMIQQHKPDLLFVDVEMPGMSGFDLVRQIHAKELNPRIVFVTAYSQYAIKAIKAGAFDFLLKPVDIDELRETVERLLKESNIQADRNERLHPTLERIRFNTRSGFKLVDPADILYCEADGAYTVVYLTNGSELTDSNYLSLVEKKLPNGLFIRINRSLLVNMAYIQRIDRKKREVFLVSEKEEKVLTASKRCFSEIDQYFS